MIVVGRDYFANRLASQLGIAYKEFKHEYYPDGEPAPRILADYRDVKGKDVILVLRREQRPDYNQVSRNLHNHSRKVDNLVVMYEAKSVTVLMPYFWLGRQDVDPRNDTDPDKRERDKGKDIGCEFLARDLKAHGASRIITFNPHFLRDAEKLKDSGSEVQKRGKASVYLKRDFGSVNVNGVKRSGTDLYILSGIPALSRFARERSYDKPHVLGPDIKSGPLVEEFAGLFDLDGAILDKKRINGEEVEHRGKFNANERVVIIVDDILSTLSTVESALKKIENPGKIDVYAVHGVLPAVGHERAKEFVREKVRRFVTTDTIENDYGVASVMPELLDFFEND